MPKPKKPLSRKKLKLPIGLDDPVFLIDSQRKIRFSCGEKDEFLHFGHKSRAYKIILCLSAKEFLTINEVKKLVCTEKTKPNYAIRDINDSINTKIKAAGFQEIPKDTKFIYFDDDSGYYCSSVPVKGIDDYDHDFISKNEEIIKNEQELYDNNKWK